MEEPRETESLPLFSRRQFFSGISGLLVASSMPARGAALRAVPRILCADADPGVREFLEVVLAHRGFQPVVVPSGEIALRKLRETSPDLVTLAIALPGINGLNTLDYVRSGMPWVPVIMVSGYRGSTVIDEARRRGARDYIFKPFEWEELESAIRRALARP